MSNHSPPFAAKSSFNTLSAAASPPDVHQCSTSIFGTADTTDDREIANVADKYGVEVPFLRPDHLAKDDTPDQPVFQHALKMLKKQDGYEPDIVLNLRPTTPLKTSYTIDKVIKKIKEKNADIVRTMSPVEGVNHPYWMYKRSNDGQATSFMMEVNT